MITEEEEEEELTESEEPVIKTKSELGLKATALTSAVWAAVWEMGLEEAVSRVSQIMSILSSPTEAKRLSCIECHATSSTTPSCPLKVCNGSRSLFLT